MDAFFRFVIKLALTIAGTFFGLILMFVLVILGLAFASEIILSSN